MPALKTRDPALFESKGQTLTLADLRVAEASTLVLNEARPAGFEPVKTVKVALPASLHAEHGAFITVESLDGSIAVPALKRQIAAKLGDPALFESKGQTLTYGSAELADTLTLADLRVAEASTLVLNEARPAGFEPVKTVKVALPASLHAEHGAFITVESLDGSIAVPALKRQIAAKLGDPALFESKGQTLTYGGAELECRHADFGRSARGGGVDSRAERGTPCWF